MVTNTKEVEIEKLKRKIEIEINAKNKAYYFILSQGLLLDFKAFSDEYNKG